MAADWNQFTAFQGNLNRQILIPTAQGPIQTEQELAQDVTQFSTFIAGLRANPAAFGIPAGRIADVEGLIDDFFPAGNLPVRVRDQPLHFPAAGPRRALPRTVQFGSTNFDMDISDGPAALGYIFSVVEPPQGPTWGGYYFPLLVLYSRLLFLGFVTTDVNPSIFANESVPVMACVMYVGDAAPQGSLEAYLYGSTWTGQNATDPFWAAVDAARKPMFDTWRRGTLVAGYQTLNLPGMFPEFSPKEWDVLLAQFYGIFRGSAAAGAQPLIPAAADITNGIQAQVKATFPPNTPPTTRIAQGDLRNRQQTRPALKAHLSTLLTFLFDPGYIYNLQVESALQALVTYFLTPHMFFGENGNPNVGAPPIPIPPLIDQALNNIITTSWPPWSQAGQVMLNQFRLAQAAGTLPGSGRAIPYGRCAEIYCSIAMLPRYVPDPPNHPPPPGAILPWTRGIAAEIHMLGNTQAFNASFDSAALNNVNLNAKGPLRYPCINCQSLLTLFRMNVTPQAYNRDILRVPQYARNVW